MRTYSLRIAFDDLVEGAFRARRLARKHAETGVGAGWQALLLALSGLAQSIDALVREPLVASDMPVGWAYALPVVNYVLMPLVAVATGFVAWLVSAFGAWIVLRRRMTFGAVGRATTLGQWSAVLPCVAAILLCLAARVPSEAVSFIVAVLVLVHTIPSLAQTGGITVSRAFLAYLLGPLLLLAGVALVVLTGGVLARALGL